LPFELRKYFIILVKSPVIISLHLFLGKGELLLLSEDPLYQLTIFMTT